MTVFHQRSKQICKNALMLISVGCCLSIFQVYAAPAQLQGYVMQVQLTPAVCSLDKNQSKQRKCLEGYSLTITGLMPETNANDCTTRSSAKLPPLQANVVAHIMPDDNARTRLWYSVGGCVPMSASLYFRTIINKAEQLEIPADLTGFGNKIVAINSLKNQFLRLNPKLRKEGINFSCQSTAMNSLLTGIQICYKTNGTYKQCSSQITSNCPSSVSIKGSY